MVELRSGTQTAADTYDIFYCRNFLGGEYPNLSLFTLVQLRNLKRSLEENFDNIQHRK